MLQKLNEKVQGTIAWIIVSLITFTFALFGVDYYLQARGHNDDAVIVNGKSISKINFDNTYRRARQTREGILNKEADIELRNDLLQEMILNSVSLDAAYKAGFTVDNQIVLATIASIPEFQEDGKFSPGKYQQALNNNLYTAKSFYQDVTAGMVLNQQRFAFIGTSFVLPDELTRYINLALESRDYNYLLISFVDFIKPESITDFEIESYFNQHKSDFKTEEQVDIEYVNLSLKDVMSQISVSEDELKRFYNENKMQDKPFEQVRDNIEQQIKSDLVQTKYSRQLETLSDLSYQTPDSLDTVAEELNLKIQKSDPFSINGGEQGIIKNKKVVEAAFSNDVLVQGNNSEPIQVDNDNVVVLRVLNKYPVRDKTLEEVRMDIREKLAFAKAKEEAAKLGEKIMAADDPSDNANNIQWTQIKGSTRESPKAPQAINNIAFNLGINNKVATPLAGGDFVIVKLLNISKGSEQTLTNEQLANAREQLETSIGVADYELYVKNLLKNAKVETKIEFK